MPAVTQQASKQMTNTQLYIIIYQGSTHRRQTQHQGNTQIGRQGKAVTQQTDNDNNTILLYVIYLRYNVFN